MTGDCVATRYGVGVNFPWQVIAILAIAAHCTVNKDMAAQNPYKVRYICLGYSDSGRVEVVVQCTTLEMGGVLAAPAAYALVHR